MKNVLLFSFLILTCVTIHAQELDCGKFKTGKFQNMEEEGVRTIIERTSTHQYETKGEMKLTLKVEWLDNCTYKLIFQEANQAWWDTRPKDKSTPDLIVKITSVQGNFYTQESKFEGDKEFSYKSTIVMLD